MACKQIKRIGAWWAAVSAIACLVGATAAARGAASDEAPGVERSTVVRPKPDLERGRELYRVRCALCHGADGRGTGPTARFIDPKPRDFTVAVYKFRSTESGSLPTDEDLLRTIRRGVPGTAMPSFAGLAPEDRWQLVYFLKSLAPEFAEEESSDVVPIPQPPPSTREWIERGAAIYREMKCGQCHGPSGRGDGPSATTLTDDHGRRIFPFDMSRGWKLKGGSEPQEIYRTFHTGLDGTPMPSYHDSISEEESWALVHYIRSLFVDE